MTKQTLFFLSRLALATSLGLINFFGMWIVGDWLEWEGSYDAEYFWAGYGIAMTCYMWYVSRSMSFAGADTREIQNIKGTCNE